MNHPTKSRLIASAVAVVAVLLLGLIGYMYIPAVYPTSSTSTTTQPAASIENIKNISLPPDATNTSSNVLSQIATNLTEKISGLSDTIKETLTAPSLTKEKKSSFVRYIVVGGSLSFITFISVISYKLYIIRTSRRRPTRSPGLVDFAKLTSFVIFKQILGLVNTPQTSITLLGIFSSIFVIYWFKGLTPNAGNFFISLMSGFSVSGIVYYTCKELELTSFEAIRNLFFDIGEVQTSLVHRMAANSGTGPFLILLPLVYFIGIVSLVMSGMQDASNNSVLFTFYEIIMKSLVGTLCAGGFVLFGAAAWLLNLAFQLRSDRQRKK